MCSMITFTTILLMAFWQLLAATSYRRVCYYTNWSQYRIDQAKFTPANIDPSLCSHIHFAFAKLVKNKLSPIENNDVLMYQKISDLKNKNNDLKLVLSIGGYNAGSSDFRSLVSTKRSRKMFAVQTVSFLRHHNFDGLDIDWEYPTASDKQKFVKLVWELRQNFDKEGKRTQKEPLLLTCAVAAGKNKIEAGYDVANLAKLMDYISVMAYDFHGPWNNVTGMNAPLFPASYERFPYQRQLNVVWTMQYWASKGAPRAKLNLGLATYGRGFQLANLRNSFPGAKSKGPCEAGQYLGQRGFLAYFEHCHLKNKTTSYWMDDSKVPYIVNGDQWIGYDDQKSMKFKAEWMMKMGFGGVSVWTLDMDDFNNLCGDGDYPLLRQINKILMSETRS
ncbi:acidic mammalian chitinase [Octopus bimaculoides]|nr:acidic mammalian chitinase [Octopus bimaculoides]|eukprot:XP_014781231.1 PREDICTED: acidic mammalian chitinase-like [Octopus bimaculoides]